MSESLLIRLAALHDQIRGSSQKAGLEKPATLIAVSKRQPVELLQELLTVWKPEFGDLCFGENYVQEFIGKHGSLQGGEFSVHLIGPLQRNKAKKAVQFFDVIETVGSLPLAKALNSAATSLDKVQDIYVQVNVSDDEAKSGVRADDISEFLDGLLSDFNHLRVCGLMTITRYYEEREDVRGDFQRMRALFDRVRSQYGFELFELSMGMSSDFDIAIEEGATVVRIGTALFGERVS